MAPMVYLDRLYKACVFTQEVQSLLDFFTIAVLESLLLLGSSLFAAAHVSRCHSCPPASLQELQSKGFAATSLNSVDFVKVKKKKSLSLELLIAYIIA